MRSTTHNQDDDVRMSWRKGSACLIFSRSNNQWYSGFIEEIDIVEEGDPATSTEWLVVSYKNGKAHKRMQRLCDGIKAVPDGHVSQLKAGSQCSVFSKGLQKWCSGEVLSVFQDEHGEWLEVKYWNDEMQYTKELKRESNELRAHDSNPKSAEHPQKDEEIPEPRPTLQVERSI